MTRVLEAYAEDHCRTKLDDNGKAVDSMAEILGPDSYAQFLASLKGRIQAAQLRASLAVNRELVLLYWQIGRDIAAKQALHGWGNAVIERLSHDLQTVFPGVEGFSARNLWRMRAFHTYWGETWISSPPVAATPS